MRRLRAWIDRDPKAAGMVLLLVFAAAAWLILQRVFAKPLGGHCRNDTDCKSHRCLPDVVFGYATESGTCVQECSRDPDCPRGYVCAPVELVAARPFEKVPDQAPKQVGHFCRKLW